MTTFKTSGNNENINLLLSFFQPKQPRFQAPSFFLECREREREDSVNELESHRAAINNMQIHY